MKDAEQKTPAFGVFGSSICFDDFPDLYHKVRAVIPTLRLNVLDRQSEHRESYTVLFYLVHEVSALHMPVPLTVKHIDCPDFELSFEDGRNIGIEVSEATTPEYQLWLKEEAKRIFSYEVDGPRSALEVPDFVNSGIVGSAIEQHEAKAIDRWVDTVAARYEKKVRAALRYEYSSPLHLVLYSNTGEDVSDYKEAVLLLRKKIKKKPPFEKVFILVGETLLLRDVLGDFKEHEASSEFDELENALDCLDRVAIFLRDKIPFSKWKWVWIALYQSLYGFMICAIRGTDPDRVLQSIKCLNQQCGKFSSPGMIRDTRGVCPSCGSDITSVYEERLISFEEALKRIQEGPYMKQFVFSTPFSLSDDELKKVYKLKELAVGFLEFVPRIWSIHLSGHEALVLEIIKVIERLVAQEHNILLSKEQKSRKGRIIEDIKWLLSSPHAKDFVS